ncbi:hypothetical protein VFPFJ_10866 [Purpureocillium lilacinum]|uniref:Uncharacterized protein n=1 Tax=Purpureocillium lilacinum TaxID=33203 RepID=A0A179GBX2_PURLI|nr:hypothetical protein VFPFJ_10866 [Purpureocillium lilacinum]OAQ75028.1 hypothetical protein VFPFJ_10866 [Purpureocillium lilacinum]
MRTCYDALSDMDWTKASSYGRSRSLFASLDDIDSCSAEFTHPGLLYAPLPALSWLCLVLSGRVDCLTLRSWPEIRRSFPCSAGHLTARHRTCSQRAVVMRH